MMVFILQQVRLPVQQHQQCHQWKPKVVIISQNLQPRDCIIRMSIAMIMLSSHSRLRYRMKLIGTWLTLTLTQCATRGWQLPFGRCSLTSSYTKHFTKSSDIGLMWVVRRVRWQAPKPSVWWTVELVDWLSTTPWNQWLWGIDQWRHKEYCDCRLKGQYTLSAAVGQVTKRRKPMWAELDLIVYYLAA